MKIMNFKAFVAFILVLQLALVGPFSTQKHISAASNSITEKVIHTYNQNTWAYSNLVYGPNGDLYLLHVKDSSAFVVKKWEGGIWKEVTTVSTAATGDTYIGGLLDLAIDASNNVHIAFLYNKGSGVTSERGIKYGVYKNGSWSFSKVEGYSDPNGWKNSSNPSIAIDTNGKAHIVYEYNDANGSRKYEIHYATNQSGSWNIQTIVSGTGQIGIDEVKDPQIEVDQNNTIHLTYVKEDNQNDYYGNYYYTHKTINDSAFPSAEKLVDAVKDQKYYWYTPFVVDSAGKVTFSYSDETKTFLKTNQSGAWQQEVVFSDSSKVAYPIKASIIGSKTVLLMCTESADLGPSGIGYFAMVKEAGKWTTGKTVVSPSLVNGYPSEMTYAVDANLNFMVVMLDSGLRNISYLSGSSADFGLFSQSNNADLSNLTLSAGTLSPGFAPSTTSYTAAVGNAVPFIQVTPTVADTKATVTVNGTTVVSGTPASLPLNVGSNTITVVVTAEDGTVKTYTMTVTRAAQSTNANLSNLTLSAGTLSPGFAPSTPSYTAAVGNAVPFIQVTPVVADTKATVTVNGTTVVSGTPASLPLNVGSNTITVVVTAEDGTTTKTYTVTITKAASSNAELSNLTLSTGTLTPAFNAAIKQYNVSVPSSTGQIRLTPTVADANATVKVAGNLVTSGQESGPISLGTGANPVQIIVTAQDGTASTYTVIVNRNSPPAAIDSTFRVNENAPTGTPVGKLPASDLDGDVLSYSILSGNTNGVFELNSTIGEIKVANGSLLDYETTTSYTLAIQVSDGIDKTTVNVTINVNDLNDNLPVPQGFTTTIDENTANGTFVGTVTATDADAGSSFTYSITSGNTAGAFAIDEDNGKVTVADSSQLDYETIKNFTLTVHVSDGANTANTTVTIHLNNLNDNKPVVKDEVFSVDENAANGTLVGTVSGSDADGDLLSYRILSGSEAGAFTINAVTGKITVADGSQLDYETKTSYELKVQASDTMVTNVLLSPYELMSALFASSTSESDIATITINVNDLNDNSPVPQGFTTTIDENTANGTFVGTVTATDPDAGSHFTYSITSGNGEGAFAIDSNSGEIKVADSSKLDYESVKSFELTVQVSDGANTADTTVTIHLTNLNDNPPVAKAAIFSIDENAANGTVVGTVEASDADGDSLVFRILSGNEIGAFKIDATTGKITVADSGKLDYETVKSFELIVQVSDDTNTADAAVTITLNNLNDNTPVAKDEVFTVDENAANGTVVGTVTASDADGDPLAFRSLSGNETGAFTIDATTGKITVADSGKLDYETIKRFALSVQVSDGTHTADAAFTIHLNNLNDNPPVGKDATYTIDEKAANGTVIGTVTASDADGDAVTYTISSGNDDGIFTINETTGEITVANASLLDAATKAMHTLFVRAGDGQNKATLTVTIHVLSSNATLSKLTSSVGDLNLKFKPGTTQYSMNVGNSIHAIKLTPIAADSNATVKINGKLTMSGQESDAINLSGGKNTITIEVTAQNGQTTTYTVTVTRLQTVITIIPVNNGGTATVSDEQVNLLDSNGTLVIDLRNSLDTVKTIKFTAEQLEILINRQAVIKVVKDDVELLIPAINFAIGEDLIISLERVDKNPKKLPISDLAVSSVYEFTIKQGDKIISHFNHEIELAFSSDGNKHPEDLKVYYWNEGKKNWEIVGGSFENGQIKASTNHFSTFAVFNPGDLVVKKPSSGSVLPDKKPSNGSGLPATATNMYNWLFAGIIVLILGGALFVGQRVRKRDENIS